jgi:excisionase family DNA binding protein
MVAFMMKTTEHPSVTERAFLSLPEAAQEISCTRRFLEKRIEDGEIAVFRPSKKIVRIERSEFKRWVAAYTARGTASPA